MKKVNIKDAGIPTGFTYNVILGAGQKIDTGFKDTGVFFINVLGSGNSALIMHTAFVRHSTVLAGSTHYFAARDEPGMVCFYREVDSGNYFVKNNRDVISTVRIKSITTPIS